MTAMGSPSISIILASLVPRPGVARLVSSGSIAILCRDYRTYPGHTQRKGNRGVEGVWVFFRSTGKRRASIPTSTALLNERGNKTFSLLYGFEIRTWCSLECAWPGAQHDLDYNNHRRVFFSRTTVRPHGYLLHILGTSEVLLIVSP